MPLLMPCEPGLPRRIDQAWAREHAIAAAAGPVPLLDHDRLQAGDAAGALAWTALPPAGAVLAYRGWMVRPQGIALLADALRQRGLRLLTGPDDYRMCHLLPGTLDALAPWSARTVLVPVGELDRLADALAGFGNRALVVKDWVKSQAGLWAEACFIPDAADTAAALRVVNRFIELQGADLEGGIALREWTPLVQAAGRAVEWRCFVVGGTPLPPFRRDDGPLDDLPVPGSELLLTAASTVPCPFWTMDWALHEDGRHMILEAGDGGVSAVPNHVDPASILRAALKLTL